MWSSVKKQIISFREKKNYLISSKLQHETERQYFSIEFNKEFLLEHIIIES